MDKTFTPLRGELFLWSFLDVDRGMADLKVVGLKVVDLGVIDLRAIILVVIVLAFIWLKR